MNSRVAGIISEAISYLLEHINPQPLSIILTGSFARGEGSVYNKNGKLVVLGDIEFLVYFQKVTSTLIKDLHTLSGAFTTSLGRKGVQCKIEYGLCSKKFFAKATPTIFSAELKENGKTVWGHDVLSNALGNISPQNIDKIDALYLTCNRLIEQLKNLDFIYHDDPFLCEEAAYGNIKILLDIPTAILPLTGTFHTSYLKRLRAITANSTEITLQVFGPTFDWDNFLHEIQFWTEYKIRPMSIKLAYKKRFPEWSHKPFSNQVLSFWLNLVPIIQAVWKWQVKTLLNKKSPHLKFSDDSFHAFLKLQSKPQIVKDWAKLIVNATRNPHNIRINIRPFLKGSPRHLIYTAASSLFFHYPRIFASATNRDLKDIAHLNTLLPIKYKNAKQPTPYNRLRKAVHKNWLFHVRNS